MVIREYQWGAWLAAKAARSESPQSEDDGRVVRAWFVDSGETHQCYMWRGGLAYTTLATYSQEQNDEDLAAYDALVTAGKFNLSDNRKNQFGVPRASIEPRTGKELVMTTHNFCDPTTWYTTSERVETETLTDSGDGLTFTSAWPHWIDMTHGNIWDEDALCADVEHGYGVVATSDAAAKTQRVPFATSGGDYTVNYEAGTITFAASQTGKTVVASYSRMVDSVFALVPDAGKRIDIEKAIARFSADVEMLDSIDFEIWVYNPDDLPNKVMYRRTTYKTIGNFIDEAVPATSIAMVGGGTRGMLQAMTSLPFHYGTIRSLLSSQGVEIRICLRNDVPCTGYRALATLYCTVDVE